MARLSYILMYSYLIPVTQELWNNIDTTTYIIDHIATSWYAWLTQQEWQGINAKW